MARVRDRQTDIERERERERERVVFTSNIGSLLHLPHGLEDVIGLQGKMLHTATIIVLQIGLDLRFSLGTESWLIDRQQHKFIIGSHYHGVKTRVNSTCRDGVGVRAR
jgi:hypothetical protein